MKNSVKKIALETSSIMPLIETTPRTLPLQQNLQNIIQRNDIEVEFYTDLYSIKEAQQQITTSFENALRSVEKAVKTANERNIQDPLSLSVIFIKSLCENWYGREETLRWSDVLIDKRMFNIKNHKDFFGLIKENLHKKERRYHSSMQVKNGVVSVDCGKIQSYWATPPFLKELNFDIHVIENRTALDDFFLKIQSAVNAAYLQETKINDIVDIYHLYSIYEDGDLNEIWSCNQQFVKRHKKYLSSVDEFKKLFDENIVNIKRIK